MEPQHIWAKQQKDGSWLMDALIPLNELKNKLQLSNIEGEESEGFQTLNGFLTWLIDRVPAQGEIIEYQNWRFEVLLMKSNRIVQVKASQQVPAENPEEPET
jgi:putative hemolysin